MGVYNTVNFTCPRCDKRIEIQSSADEGFTDFPSDKVPVNTAEDILGSTVWCVPCNRSYRIVKVDNPQTVQLGLVRV